MSHAHRTFLPAAGTRWALALYDPLVRLLGGEAARAELVAQAELEASRSVLDVGCGTGTLVVALKRRHPDLRVVGIDPDPAALVRARAKAARASVSIELDRGFADELPYPDGSFDRIVSSFVLHHLRAGDREHALREMRRVLAPGGRCHVLDFTRDESAATVAALRAAGFAEVAAVGHRSLAWGIFRAGYIRAAVASATGAV